MARRGSSGAQWPASATLEGLSAAGAAHRRLAIAEELRSGHWQSVWMPRRHMGEVGLVAGNPQDGMTAGYKSAEEIPGLCHRADAHCRSRSGAALRRARIAWIAPLIVAVTTMRDFASCKSVIEDAQLREEADRRRAGSIRL